MPTPSQTADTSDDLELAARPTHQVDDYIDFVRREGEQFARAAAATPLAADIAACPGWTMRDLVLHLGEIHLWAAANLVAPRREWLHVAELGELARYWPELASRTPDDHELVSWYRATNRNLIDVLESVPPDVGACCFLPAPSPLVMWARRQASEIAVHRFDAEAAGQVSSHFDPEFAGDMLDELLSGFAPMRRSAEASTERTLLVDAVDVGERWWLTIGPNAIETARTGDEHDLRVVGTAAQLYLTMWNRRPEVPVQLDGDASVLELWSRSCQVVWTR